MDSRSVTTTELLAFEVFTTTFAWAVASVWPGIVTSGNAWSVYFAVALSL